MYRERERHSALLRLPVGDYDLLTTKVNTHNQNWHLIYACLQQDAAPGCSSCGLFFQVLSKASDTPLALGTVDIAVCTIDHHRFAITIGTSKLHFQLESNLFSNWFALNSPQNSLRDVHCQTLRDTLRNSSRLVEILRDSSKHFETLRNTLGNIHSDSLAGASSKVSTQNSSSYSLSVYSSDTGSFDDLLGICAISRHSQIH